MYKLSKRLFDLVVAFTALLLLAPVLLLIAALVKLSSPGPVFYRGERIGQHGEPFRVFKFRSMVSDAERLGGTTTGKNDRRVTRIGALLRDYKLDELPQLINVLVGDMSLVGPRPEVAEYVEQFTAEEQQILTVPPGITDFASLEFSDLQEVVGSDNPDETFRTQVLPRKNKLRLRYVRERSFWADLLILGRTAWVVVSKPMRSKR